MAAVNFTLFDSYCFYCTLVTIEVSHSKTKFRDDVGTLTRKASFIVTISIC